MNLRGLSTVPVGLKGLRSESGCGFEEDLKMENERIVLDEDEKLFLMIKMHFPTINLRKLKRFKCEVCEDLKCGVCPGKGMKGAQVLDCIAGKTSEVVGGSWGFN